MNYQMQPDPNSPVPQTAAAVQAPPAGTTAQTTAVENYDVAKWNEMTPEEQKQMTSLLMREGITGLLQRLGIRDQN